MSYCHIFLPINAPIAARGEPIALQIVRAVNPSPATSKTMTQSIPTSARIAKILSNIHKNAFITTHNFPYILPQRYCFYCTYTNPHYGKVDDCQLLPIREGIASNYYLFLATISAVYL